MESVAAALVTGVLTLAGVLVSNSRSRAVMEVKIDNLTRRFERHNRLIENTHAPKRLIGLEAIVASLNMLVGHPVKQALRRLINALVQPNQAIDDVLFHFVLLGCSEQV